MPDFVWERGWELKFHGFRHKDGTIHDKPERISENQK